MFAQKDFLHASPISMAKKIIRGRQLVIFISLPGVVANKVGIFIEHARSRAINLGLRCSALHVLANHEEELSVVDMTLDPTQLYQGCYVSTIGQKRNEELFSANQKIADRFISLLEKVEGQYDHILIIGEMESRVDARSSRHLISGIPTINKLAHLLRALSEKYAASEVWQRIQICHVSKLKLSHSSETFAEAIIPSTRRTCHVSVPAGKSVVGRNGYAIDFMGSDVEFELIVSFLFTAVSNAWTYDVMTRAYSKRYAPDSLHHFDITCIYPSKRNSPFQRYFQTSESTFFKSVTADVSVPRSISSPTRSCLTPFSSLSHSDSIS